MLQLEGPITIGAVDYSDEIVRVTIRKRRNMIVRPATFGNRNETDKAGAAKNEIQIDFLNNRTAATVWAELWDAIDTDSAELAFTARLDDGAIGADNPEFSGVMIVNGVEVGGQVGVYNQQSWTFPITEAGITKDTTP